MIASPSLRPEALEHRIHPLGAEDAHQIVFERDEEFGGAGVALTAGAAAQLVVDAPALVPLAADDKEPAGLDHGIVRRCDLGPDGGLLRLALALLGDRREIGAQAHFEVAAELDVGAAAGHVGGDGHRARPPGLGDDVGFLLVIARVQHVVRDLVLFEQRGQRLGFFDADGAAPAPAARVRGTPARAGRWRRIFSRVER